MNGAVYVILLGVLMLVYAIDLGMLGRMIVGWFTMGEQTRIGSFLYVVTEPIILPVRALCNRFGWFKGLPFDMPFFITSVLMVTISAFLQAYMGL